MGKTFNMTGGSGGGGGGGISLSSIAVTTPPTKTSYQVGESFDATGMVVTATYTNGATLVVGGYTVSPQTMTLGVTEVTVSYTEGGITKTATQAVTVSNFSATLAIKAPTSCAIVVTLGGSTIASFTGTDSVYNVTVTDEGTYTITATRSDLTGLSASKTAVIDTDGQTVSVSLGFVYGFRITKAESNPSTRVSYLYDAVGKTPAYMDYTNSAFNYGDWADAWFVADNKPLMLKSDGTVDYYLDPDDYTKKADGTASDVANSSYDGNAMAQFPLMWFNRYEDTTYEYTIVADAAWSSDYKAYAHTDANGNVQPYFYWSLFIGNLVGSKLRSLKGYAPMRSKTASEEISYASANGAGWYTGTWSRYTLINDLCVLISKTTNLQTAFGNGFHQGSGTSVNNTGTLSDKGRFFGYNDATHTVKRFHCEFESGQWLRLAGCIYNNGKLYIKMTPEGDGYRVTDVTGMTDTGITIGGTDGGYISAMQNGDTGRLPKTVSGSETTYWCDVCWYNAGQFDYLIVGGGSDNASGIGGAFAFQMKNAPSIASWNIGAGLSCDGGAT